MKSKTTKKAAQDNQKTSITQTVYGHIPGLKLEHKTMKHGSIALTLSMYQHALGQQG